jgi:hypothetical protein
LRPRRWQSPSFGRSLAADAITDGAALYIEVIGPAVQHQLRVRDVRKWLEATSKTPAEKLVKERLRGLL